jgi:hypothetical protein
MRWSHREDFARARTRAGLNLVANVPMTPVNLVEGVIQGFPQRHLAQRFANHDDSWRRRQHPARRRHIQEAGADDQGREVHRDQRRLSRPDRKARSSSAIYWAICGLGPRAKVGRQRDIAAGPLKSSIA